MGFKVLVENQDGTRDVVHEVEGPRVIRVGLTGAQGEAAGMRVDYGVDQVVLTFEQEITNGRPTLQEVEANFAPETVHPAEDAVVDEDEEVAASEGEESQATGEGGTETPPAEPDDDESHQGDAGGLSLGAPS